MVHLRRATERATAGISHLAQECSECRSGAPRIESVILEVVVGNRHHTTRSHAYGRCHDEGSRRLGGVPYVVEVGAVYSLGGQRSSGGNLAPQCGRAVPLQGPVEPRLRRQTSQLEIEKALTVTSPVSLLKVPPATGIMSYGAVRLTATTYALVVVPSCAVMVKVMVFTPTFSFDVCAGLKIVVWPIIRWSSRTHVSHGHIFRRCRRVD